MTPNNRVGADSASVAWGTAGVVSGRRPSRSAEDQITQLAARLRVPGPGMRAAGVPHGVGVPATGVVEGDAGGSDPAGVADVSVAPFRRRRRAGGPGGVGILEHGCVADFVEDLDWGVGNSPGPEPASATAGNGDPSAEHSGPGSRRTRVADVQAVEASSGREPEVGQQVPLLPLAKNHVNTDGELRSQAIGFTPLQTTAVGHSIFHVFAALAEFIRELIVFDSREGLASARACGRGSGRPGWVAGPQWADGVRTWRACCWRVCGQGAAWGRYRALPG
ncbi:hypothetical protein BX257_4062 [Streptomyces sp. 3212.3]|nr:hypothetical protein BX257_4062 [Streptomyces sp. 3212.3]